MNKIYKVIWSKVKHQYVVVSELAHSNGKQSRTAKRSLRSRIAALVVCGAIAAFGVFGMTEQQAFAADGGVATQSQYIVIAVDSTNNNGGRSTRTFGRYTYHRQVVDLGKGQTKQYWVREGYDVIATEGERHDGINDNTNYIIDVKKNEDYTSSSDQGLLQAYQTTTSSGKITTLTGVNIEDLNTGVYGGASNSAGVETKKDFGYHIRVGQVTETDDGYVKVSNDLDGTASGRPAGQLGNTNWSTYFSTNIKLEDNGTYSFINSDDTKVTVPTNKIYSIDGQLGVFTDEKGNLYTGDVYGDNNEILLSGIGDNNEIYSYWGSKITDPTQTIGNMTVEQYNSDRKELQQQAAAYHGDDIKDITVTPNVGSNGGSLSFNRVGRYDEESGEYVSAEPAGVITFKNTEMSGKEGNDVAVEIGNGTSSFTVDAGSRVVGKTGADGTTEANPNDTLTGIEINGQNYKLGGGKTYTDGDGISISQDDTNTISVNTGDGLKIENDKVVANVDGTTVKTNEQGQLTATTLDEKGSGVTATSTYGKDYAVKDTAGNTVTIEDIASATKLEEVAGEAEKHTSVSTNDANLKVENTAQKGDAANYEVTLNKDLAVNSVTAGGENGTVINGNGLTVAGTQYVSAENGLNAGGKKIQNVAEGVGDKDAVNVSQLKKAIGDIDSYSGWTVTTNGGETDEDKAAVGSNGTVDFSADDANITIDQDGTNLKFGLANDLNVNKITTNNMYVTNVDTTTENNEYSVINRKYFNENEQHINPAEYEVQPDGTVTMTYVDGNGNLVKDQTATIKGLTTDADLAAAKTEVVGGKNATVTANTEPTEDGHTVYTVDAYDTQITGDGNVSVTGGEEVDENNVRNYNVKLNDVITVGTSDKAEHPVKIDGTSGQVTGLTNTDLKVEGFGESNRAATEEQLQAAMQDIDEGSYKGWTVSANGENGTTVENGKTVDFSSEDGNVTVTKTTDAGNTKLAFGLADELSVNKVTTSNMYVTNVDKTNDASVVNVGYFNTNEKHIAPTENSSYEASADGTVTLKYADGSGKEIKDTVAKITGLASDSELSAAAAAAKTEVVGGKNATVAANTEPTEDGHTVYTVDAYDTQITGDGNVSVTGGEEVDENNVRNYNVKLNDVITVGTSDKAEHPVKIDGTSGQVTGLTNTDLKVEGFGESNRAATEEQLQAAMTKIDEGSYKGWNVTTNKGTKTAEVASDGSVDFSNTDGNIIVGQDGTNLTFDLNDNITLGDESGTRIELNGNPETDSMISITNKDSDTVFNIAKDGTVHSDGDIVAKADSNKKYSLSEVGENAVRYNENKSTVALAGTKGTTITNVADGDVSEGSKEAVNGSQLYATNQKVDAGWVATDGTNKIEVNPTDSGTTTLNFAGDNNITVTADTTNKAIQVALNDKVYLGGDHTEDSRNIVLDGERGVIGLGSNIALDGRDGTAVIGGVNITTTAEEGTGKPVSTINGLSNTTWTDEIATAAADKKSEAAGTAATQGQLGDVASDLSDQITNSGWTASTNNGAVTTDITNGDKVDFANTDGNIAVNQTAVKDDKGNITGTNLTFDLNPDITLDDDVEDGNSVQLSGTNGTINAHNSELIFGGTGKYDNVNDMTFNQNGLTITNTQTMRDTGETTTSSTVINGGSIATGNITAGGITVNADNGGTVNGLTNKTWDADNYVSGQAATEDQLKSVSDKVNAGWVATDNNGNQITVNPKDNTLNFSGDRNVTVTANKEDGSIDVALNNEVQLGDFDNGTGVYLSGASGTISATNSISVGMDQGLVIDGNKKTINGLSNTTWDPENYVSGQAATEDQLQEAAAASKTTLSNGTNTNVTSTEKADGHIDYQVNLNKNINLNDRVYINGDPAEGNKTIVDIKSSDKSKEESIFAVEDKGNGSISIGGIDITNVDGPYLAVGDGKLKFYKDGGLATGNETGTFSVRPDGDLEISGKNSSFNVDAETGNVNAVNSSGSAIMMNDDSVALNASGNGVAISDEGILLNTNGIDEDIKLVTKGTSVSVDNDGATFTNTNTNETTNIDGGTINVGDRLMVEEDGSIYATNNNGSTVMINDNGVALNSEGNGVVVSGEGITLNTNGSAVTVDRFNGTTFTNTNTGETTSINGGTITTDTVKGLSNTTWNDELATQVANSEELQGTAATQGQLQQAVSAVATEAAKQHTTVSGDDNLTVKSSVNENGGTNYQVTLDDDITLGNPKAGNTEGERSFTINTTDPEGYVPESYKTGSGADFIEENGGFMLFATDTQGFGVFGVTAKGSAWAKDFKTYTTDIYGNNTQYSLNEIGDAVAQMSSYYNEENGKSYTVFSRYLNEAEKDNPFVTVDDNATRDIPLALRDDGAVLIGATIKGEDFTDNGIRINAETDADGNNKATITGLENTEWKPPTPVATLAANDGSATVTSRAATESQLNDLYSAVAAYDVNVDGTIDYSHIALAGAPYGASRAGNGTPTGGTSITNVAYASGKDGSEAVNVDYLNDAISDAAENGSISTSDQHLVANTETGSNGVYKPNDDGNVNLIVSDEKGNSSTITIGDVASKTELDSLKTNVGDLSYSKVQGDDVKDGDSVTTAIGKLDNKIENISGTATDADNNTVTGGKINSDGTISLTQKDKDSIKLEGQLTDSGVVQEGTSFDKETGTITITSQDKYSGETSSVKVEGIASTEVVGATNKEDLATAYKDADKDGNATTEYITDSESMVEADVALDHAIQDVAGTSYANDMVLSNRIDSVEKRLGNVEERIDKVGAMAAAIANLRTMGFDPEAPTEIAIGVGQYKSETGIAIGVFHYPNQDFMLSASLSSSGDELMGGIGATWKLGRKSAAERAKDEEARHLEQAEEMKKLAQQEKVKAQAQRHAKLLAERQQASQKNA